MGMGSVVLRVFADGIRVLQFLAGAVMLGIFSYFLAELSKHDQPIAQWIRAVEGLSGAATLYALLGVLLTFCLGGVMFFGLVAMVLDVCFIGCMVAIAIMTRHGTQNCSGNVNTPLGSGASDSKSSGLPSLGLACRLEKAVFAVSIIGIFLFIISFLITIPMVRNHRREKRFGPSPANGYTSGSTRRRGFWRRNKNTAPYPDTAADNLPGHPTPGEVETGYKPEAGYNGYSSTRF